MKSYYMEKTEKSKLERLRDRIEICLGGMAEAEFSRRSQTTIDEKIPAEYENRRKDDPPRRF